MTCSCGRWIADRWTAALIRELGLTVRCLDA